MDIKLSRWREFRLSQGRRKRRERRLGRSKIYNPPFARRKGYGISQAELHEILEKWKCPYLKFYKEKEFVSSDAGHSTNVLIPFKFSLTDEYHDAIHILGIFASKIYSFRGEQILVSFKDCSEVDLPALFMMRIIYMEYFQFVKKLMKIEPGIATYVNTVYFEESNIEDVNHRLTVMQITTAPGSRTAQLIPIASTRLIVGVKSKKAAIENIKGQTASTIVRFINQCVRRHEHELTRDGVNKLEGIVTEVLNNAEDHSDFDDWYCYASLFETKNPEDENYTGEINLMVFNFGYSIAEGFEITREKNQAVYDDMEALYEQVALNLVNKVTNDFSKENFFTLYALSQGFSRLKFEEESRGTGTIKFLNSFIGLGDYEDKVAHFEPKMHVISGKTMLICDKYHQPFEDDGVFYLSLNPEKDMTKLPSKENLLNLKKYFPGTLITAKIYLNKKHLRSKLQENGNQ